MKKRYYEKREEILDKRRKWEKGRKYCIRKYHNDPIYKLRMLLRMRLRAALKYKGIKKYSYLDFLGCSADECKLYIESLFKPGMTWENHGLWHLDHIKPLISFDLTKEEQIKIACNYTNLQPLWAKENLQKGSKLA